eukprot:GHVR01155786.1.p3 GENE.GHVR01155786.1~~GHVR01155786.1.p3  ORF type:complete len:126 (-),score=20.97 GHVR01155786.1:1324-1701(-)
MIQVCVPQEQHINGILWSVCVCMWGVCAYQVIFFFFSNTHTDTKMHTNIHLHIHTNILKDEHTHKHQEISIQIHINIDTNRYTYTYTHEYVCMHCEVICQVTSESYKKKAYIYILRGIPALERCQ